MRFVFVFWKIFLKSILFAFFLNINFYTSFANAPWQWGPQDTIPHSIGIQKGDYSIGSNLCTKSEDITEENNICPFGTGFVSFNNFTNNEPKENIGYSDERFFLSAQKNTNKQYHQMNSVDKLSNEINLDLATEKDSIFSLRGFIHNDGYQDDIDDYAAKETKIILKKLNQNFAVENITNGYIDSFENITTGNHQIILRMEITSSNATPKTVWDTVIINSFVPIRIEFDSFSLEGRKYEDCTGQNNCYQGEAHINGIYTFYYEDIISFNSSATDQIDNLFGDGLLINSIGSTPGVVRGCSPYQLFSFFNFRLSDPYTPCGLKNNQILESLEENDPNLCADQDEVENFSGTGPWIWDCSREGYLTSNCSAELKLSCDEFSINPNEFTIHRDYDLDFSISSNFGENASLYADEQDLLLKNFPLNNGQGNSSFAKPNWTREAEASSGTNYVHNIEAIVSARNQEAFCNQEIKLADFTIEKLVSQTGDTPENQLKRFISSFIFRNEDEIWKKKLTDLENLTRVYYKVIIKNIGAGKGDIDLLDDISTKLTGDKEGVLDCNNFADASCFGFDGQIDNECKESFKKDQSGSGDFKGQVVKFTDFPVTDENNNHPIVITYSCEAKTDGMSLSEMRSAFDTTASLDNREKDGVKINIIHRPSCGSFDDDYFDNLIGNEIELCEEGSSPDGSFEFDQENQNWTWKCVKNGISSIETCQAYKKPPPICGLSNNKYFHDLNDTDSDICESNVKAENFSFDNQTGNWTWKCKRNEILSNETCTAYKNPVCQSLVIDTYFYYNGHTKSQNNLIFKVNANFKNHINKVIIKSDNIQNFNSFELNYDDNNAIYKSTKSLEQLGLTNEKAGTYDFNAVIKGFAGSNPDNTSCHKQINIPSPPNCESLEIKPNPVELIDAADPEINFKVNATNLDNIRSVKMHVYKDNTAMDLVSLNRNENFYEGKVNLNDILSIAGANKESYRINAK